jgi:hypothetical protein
VLNAVIVLLGMSHERISDRVRLANLLQTFRYVVGVSNIAVPHDVAEYRELAPYVPNGRYTQFSMDFKHLRESTARTPNELFDYLEEKDDVPERIVCLDYFFLQHPYYRERYGDNWLLKSVGRHGPRTEGKARMLLDYATDVYIGIDHPGRNPSEVRQMMADYAAYRGTKTMRLEPVDTSPLYELDDEIDVPGPSGGAENQVLRYLSRNPELHGEARFLHITER